MKAAVSGVRLLLTIATLLAGSALAHQELLFATVTTSPTIPIPGEPFRLNVSLRDSSDRPVSGLDLRAQLRNRSEESQALRAEVTLRPQEGSGSYSGTVPRQPDGEYRLRLVELVSDEEESSALGALDIGGDDPVELQIVLPPNGATGLGAWLLWLVGLPLLAGLLVTLLVLTGRHRSEPE